MFFIWNCFVSLLFRLNRSLLFLNSSIVPSSPSALQHSWLWCFELKENLMTKSFSTQQLSLMLFVISSLLNLNKTDFNQTKFNVFPFLSDGISVFYLSWKSTAWSRISLWTRTAIDQTPNFDIENVFLIILKSKLV